MVEADEREAARQAEEDEETAMLTEATQGRDSPICKNYF
jgi:hypothetical protein